jgi:1,4-dihydroxy-2-naphthoyl-CoA hydrolase
MEVRYRFKAGGFESATGLTRHRAIEAQTRQRCALPEPIVRWLKASAPLDAPGRQATSG